MLLPSWIYLDADETAKKFYEELYVKLERDLENGTASEKNQCHSLYGYFKKISFCPSFIERAIKRVR